MAGNGIRLEIKINTQRLDTKIDEANKRIDGLDKSMNDRIDALNKKIDHHFYWTIGLFTPLILLVIGGIIAILFRGV